MRATFVFYIALIGIGLALFIVLGLLAR